MIDGSRGIVAWAILSSLAAASSGHAAVQGFGASTPGGAGKTTVRVTNRNDSGPGSFRDAVSSGNRHVVFDVAGDIHLQSVVRVTGSFITIDGSSAPSPGITLRYAGLRIFGSEGSSDGAHDVIVRGIRIRQPGVHDSEGDGIDVKFGAYNVLIDHVSIDGCGDASIDITRKAHDVTVAWSVLSGCGKNMLIKYEARRVTLHHNVFVDATTRNPNVAYTDEFTSNVSPDTTADVRNNLIWHWGDGSGTTVQCGAKVNLVGNYYSSPNTSASRQAKAIVDNGCPGRTSASGPLFYTAGNVSADDLSFDLNTLGNRSQPYAAATVDTHSACIGPQDALAGAGTDPLDATDLAHLGDIELTVCGAAPPPSTTEEIFQAQVAGGANDGEELSNGSVTLTANPIRIGATRRVTALRFADVTIPRGATIVSAKLRLYVAGNPTSSVSLRYSGEKIGQSAGFTTTSGSLSARKKTTSGVDHRPSSWTLGSWALGPELRTIVGEIVSQSTWSPGNELTILIADAGSTSYRKIGSVETGATKAATLEVRWLP